MTKETKGSPLAQFGPVGAPVLGIVLAIVFIAVAVITNPIPDKQDKLRASLQNIESQLSNSATAQSMGDEIQLVDSVSQSLNPAPAGTWRPPAVTDNMVDLPIAWHVVMEGPELDEFSQIGGDKGYWDGEDFRASRYFTELDPDDPRAKFENWDRNDDGRITREEFEDPPANDRQTFDKYDTDGNGHLDETEISAKEVREWDRYDYDGKIEFDEYRRRHEPHSSRDYGPVRNVRAAVDPGQKEIVVTWAAADVPQLPDDVSYVIWRRAPETVEERLRAWRRETQEFTKEEQAWERNHFNPWWENLSNDYRNTHGVTMSTRGKERFANLDADSWYDSVSTNAYREHVGLPLIPEDASDEDKARIDAESREMLEDVFDGIQTAAPVAPPEPDEWERVTDTPVTGNEYRDRQFELGVTYTYAVQMGSEGHPPTRDHVDETEIDTTLDGIEEYFKYSERTVSDTHPVRVQNRIAIGYVRRTGDDSTLDLTTWYKHVDEGSVTWYRLKIEQRFEQDENVGGLFSYRDLMDRNAVLIDTRGAEIDADMVLTAEMDRVDFSTGFRYVAPLSGHVLLESREHGEFALPLATKDAPIEGVSPVGMENPVEVRALAVRSGEGAVKFELTRWHKAEDGEWLRVVVQREAAPNQEVGLTTALTGTGVKVYDSAGEELSAGQLAGYSGEEVDLTVGSYEGLEERALKVNGEEFDLFGTLYVDK